MSNLKEERKDLYIKICENYKIDKNLAKRKYIKSLIENGFYFSAIKDFVLK